MAHLQRIRLYRNTGYDSNVKPHTRAVWDRTPAYVTWENLQEGHFLNTNALQDMCVSVHLSYHEVADTDYIEITSDEGRRYACIVTDISYTNPHHTKLHFRFDSWICSLLWGSPLVHGTIERVTMQPDTNHHFINLVTEPFSVNDVFRLRPETHHKLNEDLETFQGGFDDFRYILFISGRAASLFNLQPFTLDPVISPNTVRNLGDVSISNVGHLANPNLPQIPTHGFQYTQVGGESMAGVPLVFNQAGTLNAFITNMMTCGWQRVFRMSFLPRMLSFVGRFTSWGEEDVVENVLLSWDDVFTIQKVPWIFTNPPHAQDARTQVFNSGTIQGLGDFGTLSPLRYTKLASYPNVYYKIRTNLGSELNLIPQVHFARDGVWESNASFNYEFIYIGGYTPRIMMRVYTGFDTNTETARDEVLLVRQFDTLNFANDIIAQVEAQRTISFAQNMRHISASHRFGGLFRTVRNMIGGAGGGGLLTKSPKGAIGGAIVGGLGGEIMHQQDEQQRRLDAFLQHGASAMGEYNAPNNILTGLSGGFEATTLPIRFLQCGATQWELDGLNDTLLNIGVAVNHHGNQNSGTFYTRPVGSNRGMRFFKYSNITDMDNVPIRFKDDIHLLFTGGVYFVL